MSYTNIDKSSLHYNTKIYTGNNGANAITGINFKPDWVWLKPKNYQDHHRLMDSCRGQYSIYTNRNVGQDANSSHFTSFDTDGFTLGGSDNGYNNSSYNYVSWNWKAGTTSGISAGSQTITPSSYSINPTAGFGIYKWSRTGASTSDYFSHGLGVTPTIALQKRIDDVQDWYVNTTIIDGTNDNLHINKTDVKEDDSTTVPTSTNYYPKSPETGDYITYLFAPIRGYSAMGNYLGNGNANGTFFYTGFKPAFVLIKKATGSTDGWFINDNKRSLSGGTNTNSYYMRPNENSAEGTSSSLAIDILSNGVKIRNTDTAYNNNNSTYIYMCPVLISTLYIYIYIYIARK